jgi:hypothetical protein
LFVLDPLLSDIFDPSEEARERRLKARESSEGKSNRTAAAERARGKERPAKGTRESEASSPELSLLARKEKLGNGGGLSEDYAKSS